jgi:hypothetical protein
MTRTSAQHVAGRTLTERANPPHSPASLTEQIFPSFRTTNAKGTLARGTHSWICRSASSPDS